MIFFQRFSVLSVVQKRLFIHHNYLLMEYLIRLVLQTGARREADKICLYCEFRIPCDCPTMKY